MELAISVPAHFPIGIDLFPNFTLSHFQLTHAFPVPFLIFQFILGNVSLPYHCKKIAETEYCAAARTSKLKPCGFVGVTEAECMKEWMCCYDPFTEVAPGQNCFKPSAPIDVGMAAGLAVGITFIVLLIVGGAVFYVHKFGNPLSAVGASIVNPVS